MKILMVLESNFPPDLRVENEIKSLIAARNSVSIVCVSDKKISYSQDWEGCKIFKISVNKFIRKSSVGALKFPIYFNFWRKQILHIFLNEKFNAIHIHDLPLAKIGIELKQRFNIKCILDLHENWPALLRLSKHTNTILGKILSTDKQWRKYEINSCLDADRVIVVIEEAKGRLSELGIPEDKISVVPNYPMLSDFNDLPKLPMHKSKKVFLYAGGLTKHRGLQYVIQAIPEILKKEPSFELVILGDGNYQGTLIKMTIDLKISGSVIFHGKVPYKKVLEELGRCDIALIPHMKSDHTDNTIPHKLFQYMYCGKPVLASNCIPIERIINLSGAGKIYTWNSSQEFAAMAVRMLHDKQNLIQMASRGKESVEKYFHWGIGEKSLVNLYEALS